MSFHRFVSDCNLFSQIHSIARIAGDSETPDSVVVVFRHAIVSILQFDESANQFKTVVQTCYGSEIESKPSSSFVAQLCRVRGNTIVTQLTPLSLTFIQLGTESTSFTIPVKLTEKLSLASVDDVQFVSDCTLAVLGKASTHAWVGRTATIGTRASVVRLVSLDFLRRSISVNWSFESLPTEAFSLIALPAPKGGLLVVSPDTVSYCEDFSSSTTMPVNAAGMELVNRQVHFLKDQIEIRLDGSHSVVVSEELVLFACADKSVLACHLVRNKGVFASVSEIVWDVLAVAKSTVPSTLCLAADKTELFIGSRTGDSLLFQISSAEILLPISVFATTNEESKLIELEGSVESPEMRALIQMYQQEVHDGKIAHSLELGLADELAGFGGVLAVQPGGEDDPLIVSTASGHLVLMSREIPIETVFELGLKSMDFVFNFSHNNKHFLVIGGGGKVLLIDCGNGLKEIARFQLDGVVDVVRRVTDDGHVLLIAETGLYSIDTTTTGKPAKRVIEFTDPSVLSKSTVRGDTVWIASKSDTGVKLDRLDPATGIVVEKESFTVTPFFPQEMNVTIRSLFVSISPSGAVATTIVDSQNSLYIYANSDLIFFNRYLSLCKPVLTNEDLAAPAESEMAACLSVTDPTRRPLEVHAAVAAFAQKIVVSEASLVWLTQETENPTLIVLIENRPVLVYATTSASPLRFNLATFDSPDLFIPSESSKSGSVVSITTSAVSGIIVKTASSASLLVTGNDRGQLFAHPFGFGLSGVSPFSSEFVADAIVSLDVSSKLRIFKIKSGVNLLTPLVTRVVELPAGVRSYGTCMSPAGLAVTAVTEETDPGLLVPVDPMEGDEQQQQPDGAMMDGEEPALVPQQTVVINCPVPCVRQKHSISVFSNNLVGDQIFSTVTAIIDLQPNEMVTGLTWATSVLGLGPDVLVIGTTLLLGEETPAQGRLVVVRVDFAPNATPSAVTLPEGESIVGGKVLYDSVKRSAITVVKEWKGCVAVSLAHRLMMYQWDGIAGRLRGVGMIDLALQTTSLSFFKNFILAGDIIRGIFLLRYKEDPVMDAHGVITSMAASIQLLAKTMPLQEFSAINVETVRVDGAVGIVSLDAFANLELEIFSPVHFGQYLRHSVPFHLPSPSVAVAPVGHDTKSLVIGTGCGSICQLVPVREAEHHLASSLAGLMIALLPQIGGVNPRLHHVGVGREPIPNAVQAIESVDLLLQFLYLSTPLQAEIASRMKQPIDALMQAVARWVRHVVK